jgi:hypothetical protein
MEYGTIHSNKAVPSQELVKKTDPAPVMRLGVTTGTMPSASTSCLVSRCSQFPESHLFVFMRPSNHQRY